MVRWAIFFFLLFLFSLPLLASLFRYYRNNSSPAAQRAGAESLFRALRPLRKPFLCLYAVYFVALSALMRANFDYLDDMTRITTGVRGWSGWGRYLSNLLAVIIHGDGYLSDISPVHQLLAAAAMVCASLVLIRLITQRERISPWSVIAVIPLGLSPHFLECFSYKFDAFYMAISVLASILPLLLCNRSFLLYTSAVALGSFIMCTSYQSSAGIFPMLVLLLCMLRWMRGEELADIGRFLLRSVIGYAAALISFKLFMVAHYKAYVDITLPPAGQIIPTFFSNLLRYYNYVRTDYKVEWLILCGLIAAAFLYVSVRNSSRNKFVSLLVAIATLALMALLPFGVYPAMIKPLFASRALYGFGAMIAMLGIVATAFGRFHPAKLVSLALAMVFVSFSLLFGNALHVQDEYTDFRINAVLTDINHIEAFANDEEKRVQISGTIGLSPILRNMPQDYQILNRLIPVSLHEGGGFGWTKINSYYGIKNVVLEKEQDLSSLDLPVIVDTMYHTILGEDNRYLILLKE